MNEATTWPPAVGDATPDAAPASSGAELVPGPDAAAGVRELLEEMHVRLLAGYAADAVIRASAIVEIALRVLAGMTPGGGELGTLLDKLRRARKTTALVDATALADASWVYQRQVAVEARVGEVRPEYDADARRAGEVAIRLAQDAGLVTAKEVAACETAAAWQATARASSALLWLDRHDQRRALDRRLAVQPRVLVVLIHGEVGQGHDHFGEVMTQQLRSARGGWRELGVEWPPPSLPLGIRLAMLFEVLARRLGVGLAAPHDDPTSPGGAHAWRPALERIVDAIHAARAPLLLRHVVGCVGSGASGDDLLVDAYLRNIWNRVAQRAGAPVVVSLDLRRIERSGFPLTSTWRHARRDLATVRAIARTLDQHHVSRDGVCAALPELISVDASELADWLRDHFGYDRDAARAEARRHVASTRGGRFDPLVQRLNALRLDRHRNPR